MDASDDCFSSKFQAIKVIDWRESEIWQRQFATVPEISQNLVREIVLYLYIKNFVDLREIFEMNFTFVGQGEYSVINYFWWYIFWNNEESVNV